MAQPLSTALARKISAGRDDPAECAHSIPRALRLGFARAAVDRLNLPLAVIGAKQSQRAPSDLTGVVGDDWLLLTFSSAEGLAAVCLDPASVSAIVQMQTIGEVMSGAISARSFTDTDAAMVAPLIEDALKRASLLVEAAVDQSSLSGHEFSFRAADLRSLSLALVDETHRIFELTVDLAGGLRQGQIAVLLPARLGELDTGEDNKVEAGPRLEQSSGVVRAELNAILCKVTLPLGGLSGLAVGEVVPLTGSRLDRTEILAIDRTRAGVGRLGQCGGMRAVRLNEQAPTPALTEGQDFIESRAGARQPDISDAPELMPDAPGYDIEAVPTGLDEPQGDLGLVESDKLAAEISQLAGLTGPER